MGAQIDAAKNALRPKKSVRELSEETGLSVATINRILSSEPRDINITQIAKLAFALQLHPTELVSRAIEHAGGMSALLAGDLLEDVSDVPDTTVDLDTERKKRAATMTTRQIEEQKSAATRDNELGTDEPEAP